NKEIVILEKNIASKRMDFANERKSLAILRENFAKKLFDYIKAVRAQSTKDKIARMESEYMKEYEHVNNLKKNLAKIEDKIKINENKLADLKKRLSTKLAEREKVRHYRLA
ncbi:MAG: hypothetical protein ACFFAH_14000, partial [Promethearchaeota archaeon]